MQRIRTVNGLCALVGIIGMLGAAGANAMPFLNVVDGELVGAFNVGVGGTLYDVEFVDEDCITAFGGCDEASDFTFNTADDATLASEALFAQVFIDGPEGAFDTNPALTAGCTDPYVCGVFTPYGSNFTSGIIFDVFVSNAVNGDDSGVFDFVVLNMPISTENQGAESQNTYARWFLSKSSASPIPEPRAAPVFAVGFFLVSRRIRGMSQSANRLREPSLAR
jgi:hypothetical protein